MKLALLTVLLVACGQPTTPATAPAPAPSPALARAPAGLALPTDFFAAPDRTFVRPTAGGPDVTQIGANQIDLVRGKAAVIDDTADTWPAHPILYGDPTTNRMLARVDDLPFQLSDGKLVIGGETFEGDDIRLIAVVPATAKHPAFMLFAATTPDGIGEINSGLTGATPIEVRDRFGTLVTGKWVDQHGAAVAELTPHARRIEWRTFERPAGSKTVRVHFPAMVAPTDRDEAVVMACALGVEQVQQKLERSVAGVLDVYVYPDPKSKMSLTGNGGDGHAVASAGTLHVIVDAPDMLRKLVAHEATHILAFEAYGMAGMALTAEGLAVWVAGQYGGTPLDQWKLDTIPTLSSLVGGGFRSVPEPVGYPYAGTFMAVAIEQLGLQPVLTRLYPASPYAWQSWGDPGTIEAEVRRRLTKSP